MQKKLALLLIVVLMLPFLFACAEEASVPVHKVPGEDEKLVIDLAGREVIVPKNVETAALIYGPATNFLLALGVADRLVAINATWGFYNLVEPSLERAGTIGRGSLDMEALANYNPDVFIHKASDTRTLEAVEALGIPAVGLWPESIEDIMQTIRVLGETFSVEERAESLIEYYNSKVEKAAKLLESVPMEERKTAIVMGAEVGRVANGTMLQSFMLETAGAENMAKDVVSMQTWPLVGTEKIFEWDPDFIFCSNSNVAEYKVEELLADPTWSELKAVKDGHVLLVPSDTDSWEFPGMASCLGLLWMLSQMYPDVYSEEDFLVEVDAFYEFMYGMTFDREYLGY
ncbi:MAG: ABC transporter substrate-binding protein [Firmicutes bacterium]|nr:ABC transporter substrate-binding protein [Bacillota bacterium]